MVFSIGRFGSLRPAALAACALIVSFALPARADIPGTTTQLSVGSAADTQTTPAISGDLVVWTDAQALSGGGSNFDIDLFDLGTGAPAIDLTNTPDEQEFLDDIDGTNIVYTHNGPSMPGDIIVYDASLKTATTVAGSDASVHFEQPAIRGRYIVYIKATSQFDVDGYDNAIGAPLPQITNDAAVQARPRVAGDVVVWEDYRSGNADIYGYHIATSGPAFPIATGASGQTQPDIDGNTVVWVDDAGGTDQIWSYDLTSGLAEQLTTAVSHKVQPRISGTRVVWADDRAGNLDIYSYDLSTHTEAALVSGPGDQMLSDIDGNRVVYTSNASGFESVYLFTITPSSPPPTDLPLGCDPAHTDAVSAITLTRTGSLPVYGSRSYTAVDGKSYYLCVDNGLADGSERTAQLIATNDGRVALTPADFHPVADPPRQVATQIFLEDNGRGDGPHGHGAHGGATMQHLFTAALFGLNSPEAVTVTLRVAK